MATPATPLDPTQQGFSASLKGVLARLTASDLLISSSTTTVYEVNAIVRDMIAVCGATITFKALAQHINDVFAGDNSTSGTPYYNGGYDSDIIKYSTSNTTLSQGQEVALCMFIRAELALDVMTEVVPYSYLISYLHSRISSTNASDNSTKVTVTDNTSDTGEDSGTTATTETALSTDLKNSRRYQYDLYNLVSSSGSATVTITDAMASVSELLYALSVDTAVVSLDANNATDTAVANYRLWLITKLTPATHQIRKTIGALTGTYYTITGTHVAASSTATTTSYSPYKFTAASASALFTSAAVIGYLVTTANTTTITHYTTIFYLNGATSLASGTVNGDKLLDPETLRTLTPQTLLANGATLANLYALGIELNRVIALNTAGNVSITLTQAESAGWSAAEIGRSNFTFSEKTTAGINFKYFEISSDAVSNRTLLDNLIALYTAVAASTGTKTFSAAVESRFTVITGYSRSPAGPKEVAIAVTSWLFSNLENYTTSRTANKIMLNGNVATSIPFFQSFFDAPSVKPHSLGLFDVFDIKTVANASTDGLSIASGFLASEMKAYFNITAGVARDNGWSPALILRTFTPKEIFANASKRQSNTGSSQYGVSVVEALIGYNINTNAQFFKTSASTAATSGTENIGKSTVGGVDITNLVARYNYDGVSYSTLSQLLAPSQIISDIQAAMKDDTSSNVTAQTSGFSGANKTVFPKLLLTSFNISAFIDALQLPFAVAKSLVGSSWYNGNDNEKLTEVHLANTTIYSKSDRRSVFNNLSEAADKFAAAGLPVSSFVALGYPVSAWAAYAQTDVKDRSNNVSLRDLLSATETVEDYDADFYVMPTVTKRAVYNTLANRKALVLLFIPTIPDDEATRLAIGPTLDLPHAVL